VAGGHFLKAIVSHCGGCLHGGLYIALVDDFPLLGRHCPYAGKTIGLQFQANGQWIRLTGIAGSHALHPPFNAQNLLDVMSNFMGDDICLREFPRRPKTPPQLVEKA
jgi:hypothetical protein